MADELLSVRSATGVDLMLRIAGPGNRSYAFLIDWHIRLLLACAWLLLASFVFKLSLSARSHDALLSLLPAAVIYFLYHPIVEVAMRGRTPGTSALLIRNIFRTIDSLPALYVVGLMSCFLTAHRVRIGDMAAGTVLVLDDAAAAQSLGRLEALASGAGLPLGALELVDQILERWPSLESRNRMQIARSLLARLQPGTDAAHWAGLDDAELNARLAALLKR
jgi:uncharacterized RDD family membrane protein YckC